MLSNESKSPAGDFYTDIFIISDNAMLIYAWVVYAVLCQIINIFGIVTNIINIICFAKQGFNDSVNISFLGLSVSDLGSLVMMVWTCFSLTPAVLAADLPFDCMGVLYLVSAIPHLAFIRVSSCITAVITLERCLSIAAPLKIKSIVTPKRTTIIIVCISIVFFFSGAPVYEGSRLEMTFSPERNKTLFGIVRKENLAIVEIVTFLINNIIIPFATFMLILMCTMILSFQLYKKSKWRKMMTCAGQADRVTGRNQRVAKMVVTISCMFIVCFIPSNMIMVALAFERSLSYRGKYVNLAIVLSGLGFIMEGLNSSLNIFFYYYMSRKYRDAFRKLIVRM